MNNKFSIRDVISSQKEKETFGASIISLYIFLIFPFLRLASEILAKHHRPLIGKYLVGSLMCDLISFISYLYLFNLCINRYNSTVNRARIINLWPKIKFISKMADIILMSYAYLLLWTMSYTEIISLSLKNRILFNNIGDHILVIIILVVIITAIGLNTFNDIMGYSIDKR